MAKTVVITGAGRGIGRATATALARDGHRVVLVTRDREQGERAVAEIGGLAGLVVGDLGTARGVRATAAALREHAPDLDVLVQNAGVWPSKKALNEDGFEQAYFTNHLAPFLLNHLLEDLLKANGGRVVQVTAGLYLKGKVDPERTPKGLDFSTIRTYADTKLANLLTVPLWADRWQDAGVSITAVHPGVVNTNLGARSGPLGLLLRLVKRSWGTPEAGARPVVRLALEDAPRSGTYYNEEKPEELLAPATDTALARRLWRDAAAEFDVA
ncbi:SDR family NAD(P)-dependent oxidoreductase [Actinocorallia sp. API 0066]|uniref:SDR family NAD(P)-dependent oxidoreductase n=1 Tax=Actinocorallia sp. API 0066 TaxID=2896846 RepID=UPI001E544DEB|nr:SDR family NAD(P)-dependent oxidoreductase [Actinocorallia sp. API 0066]MCD0449596.1 SDR family NAD(P)-dependent oxidoreductase [Actinocorallia sp. API 0066]